MKHLKQTRMKTTHKARYNALTIRTSNTMNEFILNKLKPNKDDTNTQTRLSEDNK
jgi:hypothetical protein